MSHEFCIIISLEDIVVNDGEDNGLGLAGRLEGSEEES